ncbi:MAG: hypothetical protein KDC37_06945 [Flavobacteriales bacterium]|jgi:hypothetical protein|nr:hypothetical protein [Flavobacteriales bacterium]
MTKYLTIILSVTFLWACSDHHDHAEGHKHNHGDEKAHKHSAGVAEQPAAVTLDNGARWKANPETTEGIAKMRLLIEGAENAESLDVEVLRDMLHKEFRMIFQKCTMEGEAHEQLHNYLFPLKDKMEKMQGTPEEIAAFKAYLDDYATYFE